MLFRCIPCTRHMPCDHKPLTCAGTTHPHQVAMESQEGTVSITECTAHVCRRAQIVMGTFVVSFIGNGFVRSAQRAALFPGGVSPGVRAQDPGGSCTSPPSCPASCSSASCHPRHHQVLRACISARSACPPRSCLSTQPRPSACSYSLCTPPTPCLVFPSQTLTDVTCCVWVGCMAEVQQVGG